MSTEQEDALRRARNLAQEADRTGSQTIVNLAVAYALVALCERWDKATDKDGILHVNAMNFDAYRGLV